MIAILHLIFFTCAIVLAFKVSISDDMIFERLGQYAEKKIEEGEKWHNLYYCPWCMVTVGTFIGWLFMFGLNIVPLKFDFKYIPIHVISWLSSSFIAGFTWTAYTTINAVKDKNEEEELYLKNLNGNNGVVE